MTPKRKEEFRRMAAVDSETMWTEAPENLVRERVRELLAALDETQAEQLRESMLHTCTKYKAELARDVVEAARPVGSYFSGMKAQELRDALRRYNEGVTE